MSYDKYIEKFEFLTYLDGYKEKIKFQRSLSFETMEPTITITMTHESLQDLNNALMDNMEGG